MPARSSVLCRSCARKVKPPVPFLRQYSTVQGASSPDTLATFSNYPPEHPRFIDIPRPVQPQVRPKPVIKGTLPVPRNLFAPSRAKRFSPAALLAATPEPLPRNRDHQYDPKTQELATYKQRQAEMRRKNLREGVVELQHKKEREERRRAARAFRAGTLTRQAQTAPEREDERLTNPSIIQSNLPQKRMQIFLDKDTAAKEQNVEAQRKRQEQNEQDMLHTLYVTAGKFITTGKQLDEAIKDVFDDPDQFTNDRARGKNVWNLGEPETTVELLSRKAGAKRREKALDVALGGREEELLAERMKKISEELTGGQTLN